MTSPNKDTWAALILMLGAAFLIWIVIPDQTIAGFDDELQQSFMPRLGATLLSLSAAVMLINSLRGPSGVSGEGTEDAPLDSVFWSVAIGGSVLLALILVAFSKWGFIVGGVILIGSFGLIFNHKAVVPIVLIAGIVPVVLSYLVRFGLGLALP